MTYDIRIRTTQGHNILLPKHFKVEAEDPPEKTYATIVNLVLVILSKERKSFTVEWIGLQNSSSKNNPVHMIYNTDVFNEVYDQIDINQALISRSKH